MKLLLVLFAVIGCSLAASILPSAVPFGDSLPKNDWFNDNAMSSRIHNGHAAGANQFAHQVSLLIPQPGGGNSVCGGSVISNIWVLTAAHCTHQRNQVHLRFGTTSLTGGGHAQTSWQIINHANFHTVFLNNDIALVRIPSAVPLSAAIQVIRLPTWGQAGTTFNNAVATVSGWGEAWPGSGTQGQLRWVDVRIIPNAQCQNTFGPQSVVAHVVCTLGNANPNQGVCGGDSGGPLFIVEGGVRTQVGVVAFGAAPHLGGCAGGHPSGYMRTSHFLGWINQHTGIQIRG